MDLYRLVGTSVPDNLISGMVPSAEAVSVTLRRLAAAATLVRGTVLERSSLDSLLVILGTTEQAAVEEVLAVKGKYTITITTAAADGDTLNIIAGGVEKTYTANTVSETWQVDDIAADCAALKALIEADYPGYTVTNTATTVVLEQKVGAAEAAAAIVVTQAAAPAGLAAAVVENPEGVTAVTPVALEVLTPAYVLAEDTPVGTAADVVAVAYRSGCFSPAHVTVAAEYTITAADLDALRIRDIVFKDFQA